MNRVLFSIICFALFSVNAYSQLSLTLADCPVPNDTVKYVYSTGTFTQLPLSGSSVVWDFSGISSGGMNYTYYANSTDNTYPTAVFNSTLTNFSLFSLTSNYYYKNIDSGFMSVGSSINPNGFSISTYTKGATDSLLFPSSKNYFSNCPHLQYPLTASSAWQFEQVYKTNFTLTVAAFFLNKTPGMEVEYSTEKYTVVATGNALIKNPSGNNTQYNSLLIKHDVTNLDSFLLGGSPAPAFLLTAFGLTQGNITTFTNYFLIAKGSVTPIAMLYTTAGSPDLITGLNFLEPFSVTSVEDLTGSVQTSAYPNPVSGNNFSINFNKTDNSAWSMKLYSSFGEEVYNTSVNAGSGETTLKIYTPNLTNGFYFWSVQNDQSAEMYRGSIVVQK